MAEISTVVDKVANRFGFKQAKPDQKKAIVAFFNGSDVFVSLPTGSGKSFCYWCLPEVFDMMNGKSGKSIVIVVSPLIALMMDQVASLSNRGIKTIHVSSERLLRRFMKAASRYYFSALNNCFSTPGVMYFFRLCTMRIWLGLS